MRPRKSDGYPKEGIVGGLDIDYAKVPSHRHVGKKSYMFYAQAKVIKYIQHNCKRLRGSVE